MLPKFLKQPVSFIFDMKEDIPLEGRLFLSLGVVEIFFCILALITNFIQKVPFIVTLLVMVALCLVLFFYYLIRFKRIIRPLLIPGISISFLFVTVIWFFDGGIYGPDIMFALVLLMIALLCAPKKSKFYFLTLFLGLFGLAYFIQYNWPELIPVHINRKIWIENAYTLIYSAFGILIIAHLIHSSYSREKHKVEEREKQLIEMTRQLKELNQTKDRFFSIIAHDLKSPFNSIVGFSSLLTDRIQEKRYEGIDEFAQIIQNSSLKAMELLRNLLDWSRLQTGRIEFNPEKFELVQLIRQVAELMKDPARQKSITIQRNLPPAIIVTADKSMIGTVLRNLISNAVKFTNQHGEVTISARIEGGELIVSVADNGIGLKKENIDKLFRIDQQYSTTGTHDEEGTGLGLILSKEFLDRHKGRIWVRSEEGKGSIFYFALPQNPEINKSSL